MNPITNFEKWINSIATGEAPDITPATRLDHFLNKIRQAIARKSDIHDTLPEYSLSDENKVLTVEKVEDGTSTVTIVPEQSVTLSNSKKAELSNVDFSTLSDGDSVDVFVNGSKIVCGYDANTGTEGSIVGAGITIEYGRSNFEVEYTTGTAGETYTISATKSATAYKAQTGWKEALPPVSAVDNGKAMLVVDGVWSANNIPSQLPSVTWSDNGKSLTVVGGAWAKSSQDTTPLIITLSGSTLKMSAQWGSIDGALKQGRVCVISGGNNGYSSTIVGTHWEADDGLYSYYVTAIYNGAIREWMTHDSSGKPEKNF